jgi:hypothetical protein
MYTYTSHNDCDNVTARVALRQDGRYAVSLFDDDSGNQSPIVRIYTDRADAVAYADILAGIAAPTGNTYVYL